jgi:hypothetical protein
MTDSASLSEHIAGGFVRRGGVVVEVSVDASRLLQEPGDVLYVRWGDIVVGQLLYPRALSQGSKSTVIRVEYFVRDTNYAYGVHI